MMPTTVEVKVKKIDTDLALTDIAVWMHETRKQAATIEVA